VERNFSATCKNHKTFPLGMTILLRVVYLINAVCVCLITAKNVSATLIWSLYIQYGPCNPTLRYFYEILGLKSHYLRTFWHNHFIKFLIIKVCLAVELEKFLVIFLTCILLSWPLLSDWLFCYFGPTNIFFLI